MDTRNPVGAGNEYVERARRLAPEDEIWRAVGRSGVLTLDQRVLIRLASTYAIHQAKAVADMTHHAGGATSIFIESAFDRGFRDMHAVTQQIQGR